MIDIITNKLKEIESAENVRIIHAVESGSRAWGFASTDSDYDVRFIYVRPKDFYLKLESTRDIIEWQLDETLDINGWDLQKALRLLHQSNPTFFEWSNSPIIYKTTAEWAEIQAEINTYFSNKSGLLHYLSTAHSNYREYLKGEIVKLKKYFYVLRPLLACKWILENKCPPPVLFSELCNAVLEDDMKDIVDDLLRRKICSSEVGESKRIDRLNQYIDTNLAELESVISAMPKDSHFEWNGLNELFLKSVLKD